MTTFEFRLTGVGWCEACLTYNGDCVDLKAGYLTDALGDLVRGAAAIALGNASIVVVWDAEPLQYRWFVTRRDGIVNVQVAEDDEWVDGGQGLTLLIFSCSPREFCSAIADGASAALTRQGVD